MSRLLKAIPVRKKDGTRMLYHRYTKDRSITYFWGKDGQLCLRILRSKDHFKIIRRTSRC